MPFSSVTRLRLRSLRFMPFFAWHAVRTERQVRKALGFGGGSLLPDRHLTFCTMTGWTDEAAMRRYMTTGPHRVVMTRLMQWCDEASVVHWSQIDYALVSWANADRIMRESGRASKVRHPSPHHATLTYREPRLTGAGPIKPATAAS